MKKEVAIAEIERLKREKPDGWKKTVKDLVKSLWYIDHPKSEEHTEEYGRPRMRRRFSDCPGYDRMDDESDPDGYR